MDGLNKGLPAVLPSESVLCSEAPPKMGQTFWNLKVPGDCCSRSLDDKLLRGQIIGHQPNNPAKKWSFRAFSLGLRFRSQLLSVDKDTRSCFLDKS